MVYGSTIVLLYIVYEAPTSKMSHPAHQEKCPKTNLESRGVLCEGYRPVVLCTVNCTEMAYQKGPTFLSIPKQGYRPYIQMSV